LYLQVRNPLSAAISACSFVSSSIEAAPLVSDATGKDQKEFIQDDLQIIESNLHFMNDLLRNMLDIHQAHSKQLQISMKPTHLMNDVLRPVDSLLHRRSTGVRVELEAVPPDLMVLTDPLRLKQILSNLATNSMRFVSANEHSLIRIRAYVDETSKKVQVSVEDNGPGIPLEKRRESLFFRFQTSLDTLNQGTGIGLNLCKKVIELMGGNISLDDDYDTGSPDWPGTRFVLDLRQSPLDESQLLLLFDDTSGTISHSQEPARMTRDDTNAKPTLTIQQDFLVLSKDNEKPSSPDHSFIIDSHRTATTIESENMESDDSILPENLSVLFVDDDTILRKLFLRCVKKVAPTWKIQEAANGESALSIVEEQDASSGGGIDLIFLDQYMASVQKQLLGTETALALRSKGFNSLICGLSANDVASLFEEAGADCFLCKPFPCKPVELKTELLRILKCRRFKLE
jgi:CheY-like chemotaxis protein/two-component sensor histidine kinase